MNGLQHTHIKWIQVDVLVLHEIITNHVVNISHHLKMSSYGLAKSCSLFNLHVGSYWPVFCYDKFVFTFFTFYVNGIAKNIFFVDIINPTMIILTLHVISSTNWPSILLPNYISAKFCLLKTAKISGCWLLLIIFGNYI